MIDRSEAIETAFEPVASAFYEAHTDDPGGAQLCIYRRGLPALDIATGMDSASNRSYTRDLTTVVMSCTKAVVAVCAHMLVERGALDLEAPVASYWPEFGRNGKEAITVADVLSHRSGLAAFDPDERIEAHDCLDWGRCTLALERMAPLWSPSSAYLYHFITYGVLVGELISKVSGKSVSQFVADEIAQPLDLDLWLGLPEEEEHRVARHIGHRVQFTRDGLNRTFAELGMDTSSRLVKAMVGTMTTTESLIDVLAEREGRGAIVPAANVVTNAKSLAKMYAACIGRVEGVRLLAEETVNRAREPQTDHLTGPSPFNQKSDAPQRFGLGFELPRPTLAMAGSGSFGHPGAGGRLAFAHPEKGVAVAYVCTNMLWDGINPDPRWTWMSTLNDTLEKFVS